MSSFTLTCVILSYQYHLFQPCLIQEPSRTPRCHPCASPWGYGRARHPLASTRGARPACWTGPHNPIKLPSWPPTEGLNWTDLYMSTTLWNLWCHGSNLPCNLPNHQLTSRPLLRGLRPEKNAAGCSYHVWTWPWAALDTFQKRSCGRQKLRSWAAANARLVGPVGAWSWLVRGLWGCDALWHERTGWSGSTLSPHDPIFWFSALWIFSGLPFWGNDGCTTIVSLMFQVLWRWVNPLRWDESMCFFIWGNQTHVAKQQNGGTIQVTRMTQRFHWWLIQHEFNMIQSSFISHSCYKQRQLLLIAYSSYGLVLSSRASNCRIYFSKIK